MLHWSQTYWWQWGWRRAPHILDGWKKRLNALMREMITTQVVVAAYRFCNICLRCELWNIVLDRITLHLTWKSYLYRWAGRELQVFCYRKSIIHNKVGYVVAIHEGPIGIKVCSNPSKAREQDTYSWSSSFQDFFWGVGFEHVSR